MKYLELMTGMMAEFVKHSNFLRDRFDNIFSKAKIINATVDQQLLGKLQKDVSLQQFAQKKPNDLHIICEVEAHQRTIQKWAVLVTLDQRDFLSNADNIDRLANIKCVDPLYVPAVVHKLRDKTP